MAFARSFTRRPAWLLGARHCSEALRVASPTLADDPCLAQVSWPLQEALAAMLPAGASLTAVQRATLPPALSGRDVLAKARTGTGKTIAFLLPTLDRQDRAAAREVKGLVLSSSRELAQQIAKDAKRLNPHARVECFVGGVAIKRDLRALSSGGGVDLLVATPGRLEDHIENTRGFAQRLSGVQTLVLDEVDQLLDAGFQKPIERLLAKLPKKRQSMAFSATMPDRLLPVLRSALKRDHVTVDCVGEEGPTHAHVPQHVAVHRPADAYHALHASLRDEAARGGKTLVFCQTARAAQHAAAVLKAAGGVGKVLEIHSRLSQAKRSRTAEKFRGAESGVLVSSDVSARGMDYPGVTLVVQCGAASNCEQYIHRVGRTGRGGGKAEGRALLLLPEHDTGFLDDRKKGLRELPELRRSDEFELEESRGLVDAAVRSVDASVAEAAYKSWLGYHKTQGWCTGWNREQLVHEASAYSREVLRLEEVPELEAKTVGKMGLKGVPGLRVARKQRKARKQR